MLILREILQSGVQQLEERGVPHFRTQAEELLAYQLQMKRMDLYLNFEKPLTTTEAEGYKALVARRAAREPLAYILGEVEFYGCTIQVNPSVLIPRVETELLAEHIDKQLQKKDGALFWDLCSGSGCLGIAIKKKFPTLNLTLVDISPSACKTAQKNAELNQVDLHVLCGDLLTPLTGQKADYIVCNPPYISNNDYSFLEPEVQQYEPLQALVAENNGLAFYERLAKELPSHLNPYAKVWFEIGDNQGDDLYKIFNHPQWKSKKLIPDLAGKERFFFLEFE